MQERRSAFCHEIRPVANNSMETETLNLGTIVWADLGEKVMWPTRLEGTDLNSKKPKFWVYCRSDNLILNTKNILPFKKHETTWKTKAKLALKKKRQTLQMWLDDMEWAENESKFDSDQEMCSTEIPTGLDNCQEVQALGRDDVAVELCPNLFATDTGCLDIISAEGSIPCIKTANCDDATALGHDDSGKSQEVQSLEKNDVAVELCPNLFATDTGCLDIISTEGLIPCIKTANCDDATALGHDDSGKSQEVQSLERDDVAVGLCPNLCATDTGCLDIISAEGSIPCIKTADCDDATDLGHDDSGKRQEVQSLERDDVAVELCATDTGCLDIISAEGSIPCIKTADCDDATDLGHDDSGKSQEVQSLERDDVAVGLCSNLFATDTGCLDIIFAKGSIPCIKTADCDDATDLGHDDSGKSQEVQSLERDDVAVGLCSNLCATDTGCLGNISAEGSISCIKTRDCDDTTDSDYDDSCSDYIPDSQSESDDSDVECSYSALTVANHNSNCSLESEDEQMETSGQCCHQALDDNLIERDEANPGIYIRKKLKAKLSQTGRVKATDRVYNNYHCCFLCHKLTTNINKHLCSHKDNPETVEIVQLKRKTKEEKENSKNLQKLIKNKQSLLRHKGDHFHNMHVKQTKQGELIISRKVGKFKADEYGPCPKCLEWMKMESYRTKHQSLCPGVQNGNQTMKKGEVIVNSSVITGDINEKASSKLIKEVYPIMTRDLVTTLAKDDFLIVALGNHWLRRNMGNVLKRKYYTSSRMRGAARLLQHLRDLSKTNYSMSDFLCPKYFDLVCEAALLCASMESDDEEDLKSPSAALKIGFDVSRMSSFKLGLALRDENKIKKQEGEEFNTLMKLEWSTRVSRMAHLKLRKDQIQKSNDSTLPIPEDLSALGGRVIHELKTMEYKNTIETYRRAVMLVETRLLTYNKRRSGELEALTLDNYRRRSVGLDDADRGLLTSDLTDLENYLCKSQELIKIRGKNGKIVPVIVPEDLKKALAYISSTDVRRTVGVKPWNPYLFANTGDSVIRSYDSMKTICSEHSLKAPERITSVSLRKYIATLSQVIDMKDHELDWLCQHLGHTANIHKLHYRATSGFIERVNIGKLMLLQDLNLAGKYAGKRLQDIDIADVLKNTEEIQGETQEEMQEEPTASALGPLQEEILEEDFLDEEEVPKKRRKTNSCATRKVWSVKETDEVTKLFRKNFETRKTPVMKECLAAMKKSREQNGVIYKRNWETIKKKVMRMIKK